MHLQPFPAWYLYTTDTSSVRLLTDDGAPSPELTTEPARLLAEVAAALHAAAGRLGEHELLHLDNFLVMQRWRR
ncbi:hypothetical protein [Pigmentiphaga sp.]|uniref:hypothetical protein n=1 Tax=Pigmentiphaga sp. TaxID=1977564 RepID=UPI0026010AE3|nr:hypothetical protein [Pigmentiphaga sp.]